jgi:hypothetical protein
MPVVLLAVLLLIAGCGSDDGAADQIHGTWLVEGQGAYTEMAEDGTWGVWTNADLVGDAYDWGTYTFDGETLVLSNAEGSYCDGAVASWTVEFSDNGQEARQTFVEDSCTAAGVTRGQDMVLVRQTP